ncbi:MAG: ribonuclease III [Oligoflexus sp.]
MENIRLYKLLGKDQQKRLLTLPRLCEVIGYRFKSWDLLVESVTHSSAARDLSKKQSTQSPIPWNERLEFLGDSVLGLTISSNLLKRPEGYPEGMLSKIRASLVSEASLATIGKNIELGEYLLLSPGEERGGGRNKESVIADALEALFGAIYLDGGYDAAEQVILDLFDEKLSSQLTDLIDKDYKSRLQELTQGSFKEAPVYRVIDRTGPDHRASFNVEVEFRGKTLGVGEGPSKKAASQEAAKQALLAFHKNPDVIEDQTQKPSPDRGL